MMLVYTQPEEVYAPISMTLQYAVFCVRVSAVMLLL